MRLGSCLTIETNTPNVINHFMNKSVVGMKQTYIFYNEIESLQRKIHQIHVVVKQKSFCLDYRLKISIVLSVALKIEVGHFKRICVVVWKYMCWTLKTER